MQELETRFPFDRSAIEAPDLSDRFSAPDLSKISSWVWEGFVRDKQSRALWEQRNDAGMDLAMQVQQAKNFPWPNCSNIIFPLVSIAAMQFGTRSYSNLIRGNQIYKYRMFGDDPQGHLKRQALLMGRHLSWQVMEEDQAWEEQHDRLFTNVSIVGTAFVKTRFEPREGHNTSRLVMAKDLVLDYHAASVESCRRKTEVIQLYRNDILEGIRRGIYRDVSDESWFWENARSSVVDVINSEIHDKRVGLDAPQGDKDTPFTVLEQHCWMDCDGDGYEEPYIITEEAASRAVLRVVARVDREEDVETNEKNEIVAIHAFESYTKYPFIPAPDGGIYDLGFGVLLGPLNEAVNGGINQIFDAGTSNMLGGGFAASGAKMKGGVYTRTPGEWKIIRSPADDVRKALISFPEIPIPEVMFRLLTFVVQYAERLSGSTETTVGENPGQNTPAQTYQGMLDQGLQIYRSIFKRMWRSMKEEGKKLHKLNVRFMPEAQRFGESNERITREVYKSNPDLLVPVADPNLVSDQQRIQRAGLIRQGALSVPGYNMEEVERDWLEALGADNVEKIYPGAYSDWYKEHPLPNPKAMVEQMKLQAKQMGFEHDKWKTIVQLRAAQKEMEAKVALAQAQAAKLIADIGGDRAAHQLEVFEALMTHLTGMSKMMNEQIEALAKPEEKEGEDSQRGVGGAKGAAGGQGAPALPAPAGGGDQGAMGGGGV